ncbi:uncharacterized protein [Macrobrachium rosenbergii]|uniref:uncharacterized protein isoform X2 n=1 Tax=Macrobrachium rosenbergii TaxID=79674 RepID=UPI0034D52B96
MTSRSHSPSWLILTLYLLRPGLCKYPPPTTDIHPLPHPSLYATPYPFLSPPPFLLSLSSTNSSTGATVFSPPDAPSPIKDRGRRSGMEPTAAAAAAHTPQVIELAIEETVVYELKWRIQITYPPHPIDQKATSFPSLPQAPKPTPVAKAKPIAKVLPAIRERKRSLSTENDCAWYTTEKNLKLEPFSEVNPDKIGVYTFETEKSPGLLTVEVRQEQNKEHIPRTEDVSSIKEISTASQLHKFLSSGQEHESSSRKRFDPCARHRDWVRRAFFLFESKRRGIKRDMECVNGEGCHTDTAEIDIKGHKETTISDCLEEFLGNLHLGHLLDYLKVLGCMCVRDLRLLEMPELEAIQLISRRRLLQQLDSLSLHHEAPPEGCSLEAWLTWYGLTHISGFLTAIGVHSVGDLRYLREDDLVLLKPVTRRRILACNRKQ